MLLRLREERRKRRACLRLCLRVVQFVRVKLRVLPNELVSNPAEVTTAKRISTNAQPTAVERATKCVAFTHLSSFAMVSLMTFDFCVSSHPTLPVPAFSGLFPMSAQVPNPLKDSASKIRGLIAWRSLACQCLRSQNLPTAAPRTCDVHRPVPQAAHFSSSRFFVDCGALKGPANWHAEMPKGKVPTELFTFAPWGAPAETCCSLWRERATRSSLGYPQRRPLRWRVVS